VSPNRRNAPARRCHRPPGLWPINPKPPEGGWGWGATLYPTGREHSIVAGTAWERTAERAIQVEAWRVLHHALAARGALKALISKPADRVKLPVRMNPGGKTCLPRAVTPHPIKVAPLGGCLPQGDTGDLGDGLLGRYPPRNTTGPGQSR
jgi:hypothetical protein